MRRWALNDPLIFNRGFSVAFFRPTYWIGVFVLCVSLLRAPWPLAFRVPLRIWASINATLAPWFAHQRMMIDNLLLFSLGLLAVNGLLVCTRLVGQSCLSRRAATFSFIWACSLRTISQPHPLHTYYEPPSPHDRSSPDTSPNKHS